MTSGYAVVRVGRKQTPADLRCDVDVTSELWNLLVHDKLLIINTFCFVDYSVVSVFLVHQHIIKLRKY